MQIGSNVNKAISFSVCIRLFLPRALMEFWWADEGGVDEVRKRAVVALPPFFGASLLAQTESKMADGSLIPVTREGE